MTLRDVADRPLAMSLREFTNNLNNHEELCISAFRFRKSLSSKLLADLIASKTQFSIWSAIRHYIGRLGSWWKACEVLTTMVRDYSSLFESVDVKYIRSHAPLVEDTNLEEEVAAMTAIDRLMQHFDMTERQILRSFFDTQAGGDFVERYKEGLRRRQSNPLTYAELSILEHFHRKGLSFLLGDKYIGCSKPSCYACDVYMKLHPLKVSKRPCHGNTWVRWSLPHAAMPDMIPRLMQQMRADLVSNVLSGPNPMTLESTTGITTNESH